MGEVNISVNGKNYGIACDDGQEERVRELGRYVDERVKALGGAGAATSENQHLVLTAILLADEIADLRNYIDQGNLGEEQGEPRVEVREIQIPPSISEEDEAKFAHTVEALANRIEVLATRLEKAA